MVCHAEENGWQRELEALDWENYRDTVVKIVQIARRIADAKVGVLFLTADGIFLEAAHWEESGSRPVPPASELPTYRLHWWETDDRRLDGITAYIAVRQQTVNLNQRQVFEHPAWKGRCDPVFLEGERTKCKGILGVPLQSVPGGDRKKARVHGVLKVENPGDPTSYGFFKPEHEQALLDLAARVGRKLDDLPGFWREFVRIRADLKVSYLVELLERGRSIHYNLSHALGYVLELFATWVGCDDAVHLFWHDSEPEECYLLHPWDYARGQESRVHQKLDGKEVARGLVEWLKANVGPKIVQPCLPIDPNLWQNLFPNLPTHECVDVIRLKAPRYDKNGRYDLDLGVAVLPRSSMSKSGGVEEQANGEGLDPETLTRLAINVVSILARFVEDEYETTRQTYLPEHRPPRAVKTCALLFADITSFSQLTQILRLMGRPQDIEPLIDHYCATMGRIIGDAPLGRVDKFLGDGVMGIFGEYQSHGVDKGASSMGNAHEKVAVAAHCACRMLQEFRELYQRWVEEGLSRAELPYGLWGEREGGRDEASIEPLHDLRKQFNEDVRIDLGVGINIGQVFFDYFGDQTHREYTAIGDHVNFTQRLQDAAGRYHETEHRMLANILVSQTAYQLLSEYGYLAKHREPVWLRFEGFGFAYPVYELECTDLDYERISEILRTLRSSAPD